MNARFTDPHWARRKLLEDCPLFSGLPPDTLNALLADSELHEFQPEQPLYRAGDLIQTAIMLVSGSAKRTASLPGGASKLLELCQTAQIVGLGELFAGPRHAAACIGITAGVVLCIDFRRLREAILSHRELAERVITALAVRQCANETDVTAYHYGLTGTQRVLDYLLEEAGEPASPAGETSIVLKASKKLIAARIGMTPESFSRHLRELSEQGVIVVDGRKVHIQNAALLDTSEGRAAQRLSFSRKRRGEGCSTQLPMAPGALVNRCGRLRLLSQRLAIAWWLCAAGISPLKARSKLRQFEREFERTLGLLAQQALPVAHWQPIETQWHAYRQALGDESTAPAEVAAAAESMLTATDRLTGEVARLAGIPAAHYVNVAGRNRMLSQRLIKHVLFRAWPESLAPETGIRAACCGEFASNLAELQAHSNDRPELLAQMRIVAAQWQKLQQAIAPELGHTGLGRHARVILAEGERLLRHLDTTVKLFERLSSNEPGV